MEVWEFEKTIEDRLDEYHLVFDNVDQNSSIVGYSSVWASYLSNILQQYSWTGVWYPSHKECFEFNLHAPINTNVSVNKINYDSLTAYVIVHPDQIFFRNLSRDREFIEVPLKDLFVAKKQHNDEVNFEAVANSLDMLSVFYHYLIWPWDEDVDNCFVSFIPKLESRLILYYDVVNGVLNRAAQKDFFALVSRGKRIHELMRTTTPEFAESDEMLSKSMNLYCKLKMVQNQLQRFENSKMRNYINFVARMRKSCPGCHVILPEVCDISNAIQIFGQINEILPHADYKDNSHSLNDTLEKYASDETIVVSSGIHPVDSQRLDLNLTLLGLDEERRPTIVDRTVNWYFLKTTGDNVLLRNLVINLQLCQSAIFVSEGVTELDSVIVKVERSLKSVAIVVGYNASLLANRCRFVDFDVAIFCLSGSAVELTNCVFENNETCVEIMPGAQGCLINCDMSTSKNGCVKYNSGCNEDEFKSLDSLSDFDTINFRSVKINDESKAVRFV